MFDRCLTALAALVLVLAAGLPAPAHAEAPLGAPIQSAGLPGGVAVNPVTNRVYVTNLALGTVSVIDGQTNVAAGPAIAIGPYLSGVAVNPATNRVYVTEPTANAVAAIDGATNTVFTTIALPAGADPRGITVDPATNRIFVASPGLGAVVVIDGATNSIIGQIGVSTALFEVAVNSVTNRVYASAFNTNQVIVIDGSSGAVSTALSVSSGPSGLAVDDKADRVYVAGTNAQSADVIDGATNTVVTSIPVGSKPVSVAVNPATKRVYVVNNGGSSVAVIDGATNTVLGSPIPTGTFPIGVAVNPALNRAYVTNGVDNTVSVIGVPLAATPGVAGASITVTWNSLFGPTGGDLIGLYSQGAPDNQPLSTRFTNGTSSPGGPGLAAGSVTLPVPNGATPGQYEVRLFSNNTLTARLAVASATIGQGSLSVTPTTAAAGGVAQVTFGGIATPTGSDWIGLYQPGAADLNFLVRRYTNGTDAPGGSGATNGTIDLPLPSDLLPGPFELRLFSNGSFQRLATTPLAVSRATVSTDQPVVSPGETVTVHWSGITSPSGGDAVGLYRQGAPNTDALAHRFTNGTESAGGPGSAAGSLPLSIPAGQAEGLYEVRLLSGASGGTLATAVVQVGVVAAAGCLPRPSVTTLATPRGDRLEVTVVGSALAPPTSNRLLGLHFGQLQNAQVTFNGQAITSGQDITLTDQPPTLTFTVQRVRPSQPTLVPFTVMDGCGSWPSFAGGGADAGF